MRTATEQFVPDTATGPLIEADSQADYRNQLLFAIDEFSDNRNFGLRERIGILARLDPDNVPNHSSQTGLRLAGHLQGAYIAALDGGTSFTSLERETARWLLAYDVPAGQQPLPAAVINRRLGALYQHENTTITAVLAGFIVKLNQNIPPSKNQIPIPRKPLDEKSSSQTTFHHANSRDRYTTMPTIQSPTSTPTPDTLTRLTENYFHLTHEVMGTTSFQPHHRDHAYSSAMLGLFKAAVDFDPDKGMPFEAYATERMRHEITDGYRKLTHFDRRAKVPQEPAERYETLRLDAPLSPDSSTTLAAILTDDSKTPEEEVVLNETLTTERLLIAQLLRLVDQQERDLLIEYADGRPIREISQDHGLKETEVRRGLDHALNILRGHVGERTLRQCLDEVA